MTIPTGIYSYSAFVEIYTTLSVFFREQGMVYL